MLRENRFRAVCSQADTQLMTQPARLRRAQSVLALNSHLTSVYTLRKKYTNTPITETYNQMGKVYQAIFLMV